MVVIALKGGLGNQMFQYAAARGIAREGEAVYLDLHFLYENTKDSHKFTPRRYGLGIFQKLHAKTTPSIIHAIFNRQGRVWRAIRRVAFSSVKRIGQYNNEFFPDLLNRKTSVYLDGYFQSEKYFRDKRDRILNDFQFPELDEQNARIVADISAHPNAVSVHIRRGDYMKPEIQDYHGIIPLEYYTQSIARIESQVSDPHYFIFSEDLEWCRENLGFLGDRLTLIGDINASDGWKDMCLITHCRHHIIANSSFSWWGAWLAKEDGLNFAPAAWFNSQKVSFNIHDFVPESWTIVHYA